MNLIDAYRYLAALEQHRHFGRAASACHITQPALSNALRALEGHLGVTIVRRGRQYEGLTDEGAQVLASAQRILREQEGLAQALSSGADSPRGRLVVGAVPTALPIATRFAARLAERHPGIALQLRSLSSQEIDKGLDSLALDLGVGYVERAGRDARIHTLPQYTEHYYLVRRGAPDAPAASGSGGFDAPIAWAEAGGLPLCLLSPEMHNRAIIDGVLRGLGIEARAVLETDSVLALMVAVQGSGLAAVLPGALVGTLGGRAGLRIQPLVTPKVRTPIGFMTSAAVPPTRALSAALALAADPAWLEHVRAHSGPLDH